MSLLKMFSKIFKPNPSPPQKPSNIPTPLHQIDLSTSYGLRFFALKNSLLQIEAELTTITTENLVNKQPRNKQKWARDIVARYKLRHQGMLGLVRFVEEYDLTTKEGCEWVGKLEGQSYGYNGNAVRELRDDCVKLRRRLQGAVRREEEGGPPPPYAVGV